MEFLWRHVTDDWGKIPEEDEGKPDQLGKRFSSFKQLALWKCWITKNGNDDPIVNAGLEEKNSIRLYFFEFQDCIDRGFSTQDSRLQVAKLSQTLVSRPL
jgi:hypothetical protein